MLSIKISIETVGEATKKDLTKIKEIEKDVQDYANKRIKEFVNDVESDFDDFYSDYCKQIKINGNDTNSKTYSKRCFYRS
ncbi:MAG: hypothetical protein ACK5LC_11990 [Coprobacillaceae bacterium]